MASSLNNSAWVEWITTLMGGASRQTYAETLPPDRFHCLLDELPLHLIPQRSREYAHIPDSESLFLNPECRFCSAGELPDSLDSCTDVLDGLVLNTTIAWVPDDATGNLVPFWLGPELEAAVKQMKPGEAVRAGLRPQIKSVLHAAQIVRSPCDSERRRQRGKYAVEQAASSFRVKGYAPIRDLIHPFHIAALRRYYRYRIRTGAIRLGDRQSARRYAAYNEPVARFFHRQIAKALSAVAGERLKPSYVYLASYLSGAELLKHTDRPQCEFSVTLCLDFSPEPALETRWPIEMDTPGGTVKVYQALGDGLAYRGTRLPHYRGVLEDGQTSTSIFFHYVPENFTGSLD